MTRVLSSSSSACVNSGITADNRRAIFTTQTKTKVVKLSSELVAVAELTAAIPPIVANGWCEQACKFMADNKVLVNLLEEWHSDPDEQHKVLIFSTSVRLLKMIQGFIGRYCEYFVVRHVDRSTRLHARTFLRRAGSGRSNRDGGQVSGSRAGSVHNARQHTGWRGRTELDCCEFLALPELTNKANKVVIFDPSWSTCLCCLARRN